MKINAHFLFLSLIVVLPSVTEAQNDTVVLPKALLNRLNKVEDKTDKFNLYLNMHGDFAVQEKAGELQDGKFQMRQLRIEAKGNINDWISYRFRQGLNRGDSPDGYYDNVLGTVGNAWIGVRLGKWQLTLGKQCSALGGFEFDLNPIEIYEASDLNGTGISYITGVDVAYNFTPNQELHLQVANSAWQSAHQLYGDYQAAKIPLIYTLNWNGNFRDIYRVRWSASIMEQVMHKRMYYFAIGNELSLGNFGMYFDWLYSREGVDLRGIVTDIVAGSDPVRHTASTEYMSYILH